MTIHLIELQLLYIKAAATHLYQQKEQAKYAEHRIHELQTEFMDQILHRLIKTSKRTRIYK